ncbi:MAG: DUF1804 family protein [Candidatus Pacebacteria bacterium]|nr:DUF1804 family protein [Candidatus Paceibacterota bacterium]
MARSPDERLKLRSAYLGGLPLEAAARQCGIPYATARNWFNAARDAGDDWDKHRQVAMMVAGGGVEQALGRVIASALLRCEALVEAMDGTEDHATAAAMLAGLGDTISKLRTAGKAFMPENDRLAIESETVKRLSELFIKLHPKHADLMIAVVEAFPREQK